MGFGESFPGYGVANAVTVPNTVGYRLVYGTAKLEPHTLAGAFLQAWVEENMGQADYVRAAEIQFDKLPSLLTLCQFVFHVRSRCSYYFERDAVWLTVVEVYNHLDLPGGR